MTNFTIFIFIILKGPFILKENNLIKTNRLICIKNTEQLNNSDMGRIRIFWVSNAHNIYHFSNAYLFLDQVDRHIRNVELR